VLLFTPGVNLRVNVTDGLIQKGLAVNTRIKKGGKGSGGGQVAGGREFSGLNAAKTVGAGGRVLEVVVKEVENPTSSLRDAATETVFQGGEVMEGVRGLEVRGGQLSVVKALVNGGQKLEGKTKPGLAGEDSVGGIKGGGKSLADTSEAVEGNAGRVGVGDIVVVKGVGYDEGSRAFIAGEEDAEVVERKEVGW